MTDTGQIPGEGLPENAGVVEQQPGSPGPGAYTFLDPSEHAPEEDDLLLMPGAQGAWSDPSQTLQQPAHAMQTAPAGPAVALAQQAPAPQVPEQYTPAPPIPPQLQVQVRGVGHASAQAGPVAGDQPGGTSPTGPEFAAPMDLGAPEPTPEPSAAPAAEGPAQPEQAVQAPSGPMDLGAPDSVAPLPGIQHAAEQGAQSEGALPAAGAVPGGSAPSPETADASAPVQPAPVASGLTPPTAPRPLHMGPPLAADSSAGVVRSLADRGPAETPPHPLTVQNLTVPAPTAGPEYLDGPGLPGPQLGEIPPQAGAPWDPQPPQPQPVAAVAAETVVPPVQEAPDADAPSGAAADEAQPVTDEVQETAPVEQADGSQADVTPVEAGQPEAGQPEAGQPEAGQSELAAEPEAEQSAQPGAEGAAVEAGTPQPESAAPTESAEQTAPVEETAQVEQPEPDEQSAPAAQPVESSTAQEPTAQEPTAQELTAGTDTTAAVAPATVAASEPAEAPDAATPAAVATDSAPLAQPAPDAEPEPAPASVPSAESEGEVEPAAATAEEAGTATEAAPAETPETAPAPAQSAEAEAETETAAETQAAAEAPVPASEPASATVSEAAPQPVSAESVESVEHAEHAAVDPEASAEATSVPQEETLAGEPEAAVVEPAEVEAEVQAPLAAQPAAEAEPSPEARELAATETAAADVQPAAEAVEPAEPANTVEPAGAAQSETVDAPTAEEPKSPPAPAYDDAEREAVLRVMRDRRDIRNGFRSDPIPHEVLIRVLEAAHTAPSVGHSQPWDFVVIRSAETRGTMHELAERQRDTYAKSLPKGRAKQFKELKIEAILETPVNIVVTADPTRGGRHTLGRHSQPQMAPYSSALAVENLWLAARAEGLGVGWVSFFDEREMVRTLGLPEHLEVVAYLCVGYVDEFPEEPELMQSGWSQRRPLSWVVHEETYGRRALPGEEPHGLLQETVTNIRPLDAKALGEAWERQKRMTKPAGALGMLEIISAQLSGLSRMCPPPIPEPAAVAVFAGDHGVHAQGVTAWPQEVTAQMVANFLGGGAVCNAFANQVGAEVCVIDVGVVSELPTTPGLLPRKVRAGTADFTAGPAMTRDEVLAAIEVGIETARDLVAAGNKALLTGEMGIANTTVSAALICVYTGLDPAEITGRGTGINDEMHARKVDVVRRALELHAPDPADPIGVLAAVGGLEHAALVGLILGGASLRTPVLLDGVSAGAAALLARAIAPEALAACIAGHRSAEPGHVAALNKLGLRPLVDLDLRLGEGTGALLALPVVQSAARAMHEVATFDTAGVTEK
ncbi:nicotinate-nucleotide--dimethylbenzimidazole phosphoribosyltransferase [Streptomyces sp. NPDC005953]|uniref:nicotinate-nucleotide--dimethylbenzimidazole phosphoribosyltransferase n=1 Tax=Streptomyces sp. NPDC005953 TaxID=3156719 RepID=UPI0033CEF8B8